MVLSSLLQQGLFRVEESYHSESWDQVFQPMRGCRQQASLNLSEYSRICYIGFHILPTSGTSTLLELKLISWGKGTVRNGILAPCERLDTWHLAEALQQEQDRRKRANPLGTNDRTRAMRPS